MCEAIASKNRPARISEPSRVITSIVQHIKEDVVCEKIHICSIISTDQVPQPVQRDTIVLIRMAAPTDFRGTAYLQQSAPTVQAQVSSTTGCCNKSTCDNDCTQATFFQYHQNGSLIRPMDSTRDRAGSLLVLYPLSVITSSSCPAFTRPHHISSRNSCHVVKLMVLSVSHNYLSTTATTTMSSLYKLNNLSSIIFILPFSFLSETLSHTLPASGGSFNLKSINKMQSVNVSLKLNNNYNDKGNEYLSSETAVTEPKITTEPQRNISKVVIVNNKDEGHSANNNSYDSVKLLELVIVKVNDKNVNNNGALNLFPNQNEQTQQQNNLTNIYIPDIVDIPVVLLPIVQGKKYSNYYPPKYSFKKQKLSEIDEYAFIMMNAESERKSGKQTIHQQFNNTITSNDDSSLVLSKEHNHDTCDKFNNNDQFTNLTTNINNINDNNKYYTLDQLIAQQLLADHRERHIFKITSRRLRLCGGGESSLNTGTTGWGSPPAANSNNNNGNNSTGWGGTAAAQNANNQSNWNNNTTRNSTGQGSGPNTQDSNNTNKSSNPNAATAQSANSNQPPPSQAGNQGWNTNNSGAPNKVPGASNTGAAAAGPGNPPGTGTTTTTSTKQQLEQLNSMREALFSQDGWGGQHVNQDTNWDVPSSPDPVVHKDGFGIPLPSLKPTVNNGTELWEANLRNGGQPTTQPIQKTPWGHTPTTNIGGTWGEEDDVNESSNVWTGVPNIPPLWGGQGSQANNSAMWSGSKKEGEWGNNASGSSSGWGDPRAEPRAPGMDPRETLRASSMDPRNSISGPTEPRDSMRMVGGDPMRDGLRDPRDLRGITTDMRGDPRGISGRLNGDAMWGAPPHPPHQIGHHQPPGKMVGPAPNGVNQWSGPQPKDIGMPNKPSGWEEPSPPSQRRQMPNFDDGTSLWGNPAPQPNRMAASGKLSHWTDLPSGAPMGNRGNACPPGMVSGNSRKPTAEGALWGGRNGSWGEDAQQHQWNEEAWSKPKPPMPWGSSEIDWHKQGPKLTKEIIWNSKAFRQLVEMGHKKEEVENALRLSDMNLDDALDMLSPVRTAVDSWRNNGGGSVTGPGRHDEHSYDHNNSGPYGQRFGPGGPGGQMQFPPSGNVPNVMNNMSGSLNNPSLQSISNMSPAAVQKILQTGNPSTGAGSASASTLAGGYGSAGSQGRAQPPPTQSQPSTQQLRMLVQQIQMAVQAGYLNHQILNQPLAPQTLILLNQLLQHIKLLQTLMQQHSHFQSQSSLGKTNNQAILQVTVNITKTKQTINNLQNQIAANQANYVKQQQMGSGSGQDLFKNNLHDPMSALQSNFTDITLNKEPPTSYTSQQQSRLQQWIKPDKEDVTGDFSRAPGSIAKPPASHSSPSMNLGLGQSDGPWSTGRSNDSGGWPDSAVDGPDSGKDVWPSTQASPAAFLDVVPEFEPGKPWKMKSIEDDPTITPGSIVRSPLSLATIKDTEIFSSAPPSSIPSKASPPVEPLCSITSSTWTFNPPIPTTAFSSPLNKIGSTKGTWGDITPQPTAVTTELWGAPMGKRGPPPGLGKGVSNVATNGWSGMGGGTRSNSGAWGSPNWGSPWLLLRNLTAQIDGSTLQTLCKQHGPLQSFHLYSNLGFALAKYSSREEAIKAQTALNNCVLGNTTILAESPAESEVNTLMQNLAQQSGSSGAGWRGGGANKGAPVNNAGGDTWGNACWPPNPPVSSSLWGVPQSSVDSDAQRATPSSLNSYLPGDLLGGESM